MYFLMLVSFFTICVGQYNGANAQEDIRSFGREDVRNPDPENKPEIAGDVSNKQLEINGLLDEVCKIRSQSNPVEKKVDIIHDPKYQNVLTVMFRPYNRFIDGWEFRTSDMDKVKIIKNAKWKEYETYHQNMNEEDFNTVVNASEEEILAAIKELEKPPVLD